ncbi:MAG TPA: hypothetical protein VG225_12130 [Terracidiphilus sp.]|nr:hypothetical protein [Terracidiphilus sp.]
MPANRILSGVVLLVWVIASAPAQPARQTPAANPQNAPSIEMANVLFRYSPDLTVLIVRLRGALLPTQGHSVPSFNDPASFVVGTDAAEMRMTTTQLSALMNSWLLRSPKAQLKNVRIAAEGNQLRIRGTMKKGLHIPFNSTADLAVTSDNRIRLTVRQVKAASLPVKGLMDTLGLSLDDLIGQKGLHGLSVDKDSFLIDPQTAFPPPQIRARLTSIRIAGQSLVLSFGQGAPALAHKEWKNYIYMRGGSIEYGREEMFDSDLAMIDSTPADPFEFYLKDYWCQIVNGTIKATPGKGLRIYVPDYSKLRKGACRQ